MNRFAETQIEERPDHAALLAILDAENGLPVSFAALAARGVPRPATLVYELEVAGYSIERVYAPRSSGARPLVGVRRAPSAFTPEHAATAPRRSPLTGLLASLSGRESA